MLPHAHIVVIIHPDDRYNTSEDIDKLVSVEMPREPTYADNEETREYLIETRVVVAKHIAHSPCGAENPSECISKSDEGAT
jgi:hypothetical protein